MILKYTHSDLSKHRANYYTRAFADVFQNHELTFSHADFQRKNVLVRDWETQLDSTHPGLVIIDWEFAG